MRKIEARFRLFNLTKGAARYQQTSGEQRPGSDEWEIGTLYIRKWKAGEPAPEEILVTVEEV